MDTSASLREPSKTPTSDRNEINSSLSWNTCACPVSRHLPRSPPSHQGAQQKGVFRKRVRKAERWAPAPWNTHSSINQRKTHTHTQKHRPLNKNLKPRQKVWNLQKRKKGGGAGGEGVSFWLLISCGNRMFINTEFIFKIHLWDWKEDYRNQKLLKVFECSNSRVYTEPFIQWLD